jgi:hypothetical protein
MVIQMSLDVKHYKTTNSRAFRIRKKAKLQILRERQQSIEDYDVKKRAKKWLVDEEQSLTMFRQPR